MSSEAIAPQMAAGYTRTMIRIRDIDHIVFRVKDLARMAGFYQQVLGARFERDQPEIGLYQLRIGNALIDLVPVNKPIGREGGAAPGKEGRNVDHVCFRVDPWDETAILAHLSKYGIAAKVFSRYGAEGEGPSIYLHDPEGNMLELKGPAWPPGHVAAD
jgi:glyoxylase I family protein